MPTCGMTLAKHGSLAELIPKLNPKKCYCASLRLLSVVSTSSKYLLLKLHMCFGVGIPPAAVIMMKLTEGIK